jgi:shikimate dehydrogenase
MEENENQPKHLFGLVGRNISYSFSKGYFAQKFKVEGFTDHQYVNFDLQSIDELPDVVQKYPSVLRGMNVTIPYKQEVFAYMDSVDEVAQKVRAVNTIKITQEGDLKGYNTDVVGFRNSIVPLLKSHHQKALILGTGGASKAVANVFEELEIEFLKVSRNPKNSDEIAYAELNKDLMLDHTVLVNCTPLGTFPNVERKPDIPYKFISENHLLYDLIYNPNKTAFLQEGEQRGAQIKNGLEMLELQAEESWRIWSS